MSVHIKYRRLFQFLHNQSSSRICPTYLNALLNRAIKSKSIKHATQIHTQILTNGFRSLTFLFNNLLNLYAKCGHLHQSLTLFNTTPVEFKNHFTWTCIISQFCHNHKPNQALEFFSEMRRTGLYPSKFCFSPVLSACASTKVVFYGEQIHSLVCKHGFESNLFVGSALADMYAKCGVMISAEKVFDEMPKRTLVSWNVMIVGFVRNQMYNRAIRCFKLVVQEVSVCPDEVSLSSIFTVFAKTGDLKSGKQVHALTVKYGLNSLLYVKNSLIDMYCKCKIFRDAVELFQTMDNRDVATWNIIITGCAQNREFKEACNYFRLMRFDGISPDETSFSTVLHAIAHVPALDHGIAIHTHIIKNGIVSDAWVSSPLITMYAKCGNLIDARQVFDESDHRNAVSWTAIISACQQHGCVEDVIELFETMIKKNVKPNHITFVSVLSACSHTGRVDEGFKYFNLMINTHNINPTPEHYACMVDMLARAGRLNEAMHFAESNPVESKSSVWGSLLAACENWGKLEMGCKIANRLFEIEPNNLGNYIRLYNMYLRNGYLREADELKRTMETKEIKKQLARSWIDVKNTNLTYCLDI